MKAFFIIILLTLLGCSQSRDVALDHGGACVCKDCRIKTGVNMYPMGSTPKQQGIYEVDKELSSLQELKNHIPRDELMFGKDRVKDILRKADLGDDVAKYKLSHLYSLGHGVKKDISKSLELLTDLAENKNSFAAMVVLHSAYSTGRVHITSSTPKNKSKAFYWALRMAEYGHLSSCWTVGLDYAMGNGTPVNFIRAHAWLNIFSSRINIPNYKEDSKMLNRALRSANGLDMNGDVDNFIENNILQFVPMMRLKVRKDILNIEKKMTREQIAIAQETAISFQNKIEENKRVSVQRKSPVLH